MDFYGFVAFFLVGSIAWVGLAIAVGLAAERRGYSGLIWFVLSIATTPIVAMILLLAITPRGGPMARP